MRLMLEVEEVLLADAAVHRDVAAGEDERELGRDLPVVLGDLVRLLHRPEAGRSDRSRRHG